MNELVLEHSPLENLERCLERIQEREREINAFIELNPRAEEEARRAERHGGRLCGLTVAVKSNINVRGLRATCASKTLENYVAPYDAVAVQRLRSEGAVIVGMANMDEFACGSSGETSYFGPTQNPAAEGRIPGGSSSGSAAAVAAGFADAALGSDTGGSIRNPASHCGVVGIKPTYGLVPRHGLIDLAMSLDQIGPIARDVRTAALLLEVIAGRGREASMLDVQPQPYTRHLSADLAGVRVGFAREFEEVTSPEILGVIKRSLRRLEAQGAEVVEVELPSLEKALPTYYLIVFVEFFSATRRYDGRRYGYRIEEVCGAEVLRRIHLGSYISQKEYAGRYYRRALQFRSLIRRELLQALEQVDVLAAPTTPKLPHRLGESLTPLEMYAYDLLTVPANLAGIPAGVVPAGRVRGIPVGLQVHAKPLEEQVMLNVMLAAEGAE
ncbi:MAG: Asp-tRNA(Asn)/Glu-tRNA(Gln) amidotransferase subunit GatA [Euryarchaeota archaeon]|nr:Asp-tRNA(Asn)/Glu-tRNA(Gln) amidotransferase subunit GatA [Euryarchaeota archaeon]